MKKYIVALFKMLTSKKWMVITIDHQISNFISNKIDTTDSINLSIELMEMSNEILDQEWVLSQFKNNAILSSVCQLDKDGKPYRDIFHKFCSASNIDEFIMMGNLLGDKYEYIGQGLLISLEGTTHLDNGQYHFWKLLTTHTP